MNNEVESIEKIASKLLSKSFGREVIVHSWVMSEITDENPDWHEKDEKLSLELVKSFLNLASTMNKDNVRFEITDRSGDETEPHYAIDIEIGNGKLEKAIIPSLYVEYKSTVEGEEHFGDMKSTAIFDGTAEEEVEFAKNLFEEYCTLLETYYPEFDTLFDYEDNGEYVMFKDLTDSLKKTR